MTTHTKEKLGVMLDVVIEKGNNNYILCPGQAVPIHMENTLFEDLYDVRLESIWLLHSVSYVEKESELLEHLRAI